MPSLPDRKAAGRRAGLREVAGTLESIVPEVQAALAVFRNRSLVTLMAGHFTVDAYAGLLPVLYPLLIHKFSLKLATVGLVALAYTGLASVSQPFFGMLADRYGTRMTGLALAWTACSFAAIGFAPTFPILLAVAAFSGLGSGAFHPVAAVSVGRLVSARARNTGMSVYVTAGTIGLAAGPVIGVVLFGLFDSRGTAAMLVPGLLGGVWLLIRMRPLPGAAPHRRSDRADGAPVPWLVLAVVILVMMSRNWTVVVLQAFTPTWYHSMGFQPWFYGPLAATLVLASAIGTVGSGTLADRFGRRAIIIGTLVLSIPAVWLYVRFPGPQAFGFAVGVGMLAASSGPLLLVIAQDLLSHRAGFASGLILGLGFVTGAIGVPVTGAIADRIGLQAALELQVAVVAATIVIAWFLPTERYLGTLKQPGEERPAALAPAKERIGVRL